METVFVLNGPNLNLLGTREPEIYGSDTLDDIAVMLDERAAALGLAIDMRQTNHEGVLVDWLHEARETGVKAVLLNAGAYTHTSIALLDAIKAIGVPVIEAHHTGGVGVAGSNPVVPTSGNPPDSSPLRAQTA